MKLWTELDVNTKNIIRAIIFLFSIFIMVFFWFNIFKIDRQLNDFIVISRTPVKEVRLISAKKKSDGYYITAVDRETAKSYDDIYLTKTCPSFRVVEGITMNVVIFTKENPNTGERVIEIGRAYDYICTNKNMENLDKEFLDTLKKADEAFTKDNPEYKENK